jgi:hypothetical protein
MENDFLSDAELEEIAEYALNPLNWGHRHQKKEATMEDVNRMMDRIAEPFRILREDYLKVQSAKEQLQRNYGGLLN